MTELEQKRLEKRIILLENSIINCVKGFQKEGTVRLFGSHEATINFFLTRYKKDVSDEI